MDADIRQTLRRGLGAVAAIVALAVSVWLWPTIYVSTAGIEVPGRVIEKRQRIVMPGGDSWKRVFEVTYQYRPRDEAFLQTGGHRIDAAFYHRLQVGSTVSIRYSPSRFVRHMEGVGSFVVGSSPLSRLPYGPSATRDSQEIAGFLVAAFLGIVAYRRRSKRLGVVAGLVLGACIPSLLLVTSGLFLLPTLYWAWREHPGRGYGWALAGTIALCTAVVAWRVPQPAAVPADAVRTTAIVRQIKVVDQIWTVDMEGHTDGMGGEPIPRPFQMLELEFAPPGVSEPLHVVDRIDLDSVPGLRVGAVVPVEYSASDPQLARVAEGRRNYAREAEIHLLSLTYGFALAMTFIIFEISRAWRRLRRSSPVLSTLRDPSGAIRQVASKLPAGDPRRKAFEEMLRSIKDRQGRDQ